MGRGGSAKRRVKLRTESRQLKNEPGRPRGAPARRRHANAGMRLWPRSLHSPIPRPRTAPI